MLKIKLVCVGKLKERFYREAANEYIKRLGRYCNIEVVELSEVRLDEKPSIIQIEDALFKEATIIEKNILPGALTVALCIEGDRAKSSDLSEFLENAASGGTSRLNFIIGSSHGLHSNIKLKSDMLLSMSNMTFPHNLARVMLLEQLYRAFNIMDGGKYHK